MRVPYNQSRIYESITTADCLKLVSYISLGLGREGCLLYLGEMMLLLGDLLKIIGVGDEIGDLLQHFHLLNY